MGDIVLINEISQRWDNSYVAKRCSYIAFVHQMLLSNTTSVFELRCKQVVTEMAP